MVIFLNKDDNDDDDDEAQGQNWPNKDSNPAHWMAFEIMKAYTDLQFYRFSINKYTLPPNLPSILQSSSFTGPSH